MAKRLDLKDVNIFITDEFTQDGEPMRKFVVECLLDPSAEINPTDKENNKTASAQIQVTK